MTSADLAFLAIASDADFDAVAEAAFRRQMRENPVYQAYAEDAAWTGWKTVPYLPVEAFKLASVAAFDPSEAEAVFESSGTGQGTPARRYVQHLSAYEASFCEAFRRAFGSGPFTLVGHLPAYAERGARSSLLYMVEGLVEAFGDAASGLFLEDHAVFERALAHAERSGTPLVLFGAAFGLMDLVDARRWRLPDGARVVETGGMKTHRREMSRAALHAALADGFGLPAGNVWSEYGMAELLSQAYAPGGRGCACAWSIRSTHPKTFPTAHPDASPSATSPAPTPARSCSPTTAPFGMRTVALRCSDASPPPACAAATSCWNGKSAGFRLLVLHPERSEGSTILSPSYVLPPIPPWPQPVQAPCSGSDDRRIPGGGGGAPCAAPRAQTGQRRGPRRFALRRGRAGGGAGAAVSAGRTAAAGDAAPGRRRLTPLCVFTIRRCVFTCAGAWGALS